VLHARTHDPGILATVIGQMVHEELTASEAAKMLGGVPLAA
jgi:hypothetical protein